MLCQDVDSLLVETYSCFMSRAWNRKMIHYVRAEAQTEEQLCQYQLDSAFCLILIHAWCMGKRPKETHMLSLGSDPAVNAGL